MSNNRYALSQGIIAAKALAIAKLAGAGLNLVVQLALIRVLASDDYAVFLLCASFATVLAVITMLGVDRVVYRHIPNCIALQDYRSIRRIFNIFLATRLLQTTALLFLVTLLPHALLPSLFDKTLSTYLMPLALFCVALSITDSLAIYANSLGLQRKQSISSLAATLTRATIILILIFSDSGMSLAQLLWWFVATEAGYVIALTVILAIEFRSFNTPAPLAPVASLSTLLVEGAETQISYLLRLPFLGASVRLMVATIASPAIVAAFGFFQTLADRLYQFLPLILFKGIVEPGLSDDYQRTGDPQRIATALSLLLRLNLVVLVPAVVFLVAGQETFAILLAGNQYGAYWHFAPLAILLIVAQFTSEMLWTGMNPMGNATAINRIWRWCSALGIVLLCIAVALQSIEAIICACIFPNIAVICWLRYSTRHPLLLSRWSFDGFYAIGKSTVVAATVIFLTNTADPAPMALGFSVLVAATAYLLLLKRYGLFTAGEVQAIRDVAPGAARIFQLFSRKNPA